MKEGKTWDLYTDENFPRRVVLELRQLGYDVLTLKEEGKAGKRYPDHSVLEDAAALGRVLVTLDWTDFRHLHEGGQIPHQGIVLCKPDNKDPERLAANIHAALSDKVTMKGEIVKVYRPVLRRTGPSDAGG